MTKDSDSTVPWGKVEPMASANFPLSSGYLYVPMPVQEAFFNGSPPVARCVPIGEYLQIEYENEPVNIVARVELKEWHVGKLRERKMNGFSVYVNRWTEHLEIKNDNGDSYVPGDIYPATTEAVDLSQLGTASADFSHADAEDAVDQYVIENGENRATVTSKDVAQKMGIAPTIHNLIRIHDVLDAKYDVQNQRSGKITRFKLEEEA